MDNTDQHLQQLFAAAREDAPKISYQRVQQRFLAVGSATALAVWCHYMLKSFTSKFYLMTFSSLAIIGISTAVLVHTNNATTVPQLTPSITATEVEHELEVIGTNTPKIKESVSIVPAEADAESTTETVVKVFPEAAPTPISPATFPPLTAAEETAVLVTPQELTPDSLALPRVQPPDSNVFRYTLTQESTMDDLRKISEQAEKAGVEFSYSARVRKNRFRKLDIKMKFKEGDPEHRYRSEVRVRGHQFTTTFGWLADSTGKAVSFL